MTTRAQWLASALGVALLAGGCTFVVGATVSSTGEQANGGQSSGPTISASGRYAAYDSEATNLVPDDTNGVADVFERDLMSGVTQRVSVSSAGVQGNGASLNPKVSGNGRFVVFKSDASNLVPGDTNGTTDVFVRDQLLHVTTRVNLSSSGTQANDRSSFVSSPNISRDGHTAVFVSEASNLVPGVANDTEHVYAHDLRTGATELIDVALDGHPGNAAGLGNVAVSGDGRYVIFASKATNLVTGDTNGHVDTFVRDRVAGVTERVSVASDGTQGNGDAGFLGMWITADGRYVTFRSAADNLVPGDTNGTVDVFVHDRRTGRTERASVQSGGGEAHGEHGFEASDASISDSGRFVEFDAFATDLVPAHAGGSDVYVHDRLTERTALVSAASDGTPGDFRSGNSQISGNGRYVVYGTVADNLVPNDRTEGFDIVVGYTSRPQIDGITPNVVPRGATDAMLTVHGAWFLPSSRVFLGNGVRVRSIAVLHGTTIQARVDIAADAVLGGRGVSVANPGAGPGPLAGSFTACSQCLTITAK